MAGNEERLREAEEARDAEALFELSGELGEAGEDALEARALNAAAQLGHVDAAIDLGHLLYEQEQLDEALGWWRWAADKGDAEGAHNAGAALEALGRRDDALESYRRAAAAGHTPAHANAGVLLEHSGDGRGAETAYRAGAEAGDGTAAFNLGVLLYRRGDDDGARAAFRRAIELGDENAEGALEEVDGNAYGPVSSDVKAVRVLLEEANADPDEPLEVEHWLYLPDEQSARGVAAEAATKGFALDVGPSAEDDGRWLVRATRLMYPRPEAFARAGHPLARMAAEAGGEYDGWEAPKRS